MVEYVRENANGSTDASAWFRQKCKENKYYFDEYTLKLMDIYEYD